jgi:hypothetical protein
MRVDDVTGITWMSLPRRRREHHRKRGTRHLPRIQRRRPQARLQLTRQRVPRDGVHGDHLRGVLGSRV